MPTRKWIVIPAVLSGLAAGTAGVVYAMGLGPFSERGTIDAGDVCESIGTSKSVTSDLAATLPDRKKYSFEDDVHPASIRLGDSDYTSDCFVQGDGDLLLSVRTELLRIETSMDWWSKEALGRDARDPKTFAAGIKGVTTNTKAAILAPCAQRGNISGGEYGLSVVVDLKQSKNGDESKIRDGLKELAISAAEFSHQKAQCDAPAKLP